MDPWARWYRVHGVKQSKRWHLFFFFLFFFFFFIKDLHQICGLTIEGIIDISCIKNHVQVTCVRPRLRLTMEMDGGGEIERN
jgi:hypothetical protein